MKIQVGWIKNAGSQGDTVYDCDYMEVTPAGALNIYGNSRPVDGITQVGSELIATFAPGCWWSAGVVAEPGPLGSPVQFGEIRNRATTVSGVEAPPTIEELQKILDSGELLEIVSNPDGSITAVPAE